MSKRKFLRVLLSIVIAVPVIFGLYILAMTLTDYNPPEKITLKVDNNSENTLKPGEDYSAVIFNIGYCGLDDKQDFFMDGGKGSRSSSKEQTEKNMEAIIKFLSEKNSDFILLQEVDEKATRSQYVNEYEHFVQSLNSYGTTFAYNYKVLWVPVPISKPMGYVRGGLLTLSKYNISSSVRYQYPGKESWPTQLAELDRCFIETRLPVDGGKELVLINSHLSAYDKGGRIRKQQLEYLDKKISDEYSKGNYVIVGGDFNHQIPGTDPSVFKTGEKWPDWLQKIPDNIKPVGFRWVSDPSTPTNRTIAVPYKKDFNFLSIIDGFLISDNVEKVSVNNIDLQFKNSDHNPSVLKFRLK